MLIEWSADLSVGNAELDAEHRQWIVLLNDFYMGLKNNSPSGMVHEHIHRLIDYTKFHFANEEKYMKVLRYPDFDGHKEKHELYLDKLTEYDEKLKAGKLVLTLDVTNYLKSWLVNHIKGADKQYAIFAETKKS